jgi:hypothetical protein
MRGETLRLNIDLGNDCFQGEHGPAELARCLRAVANSVEAGKESGKVMDINGNSAGYWEVE